MKKILSIILGAVALVITASCAEEINGPGSSDNGKERIITVIATDKPAVDEEDSKTFIDGTSVKWSETGEYLKVYEVATPTEGAAITSSAVSSEGVTTDSGATMTFGVSLADKSGGSYTAFDYYAVYPSSAVQSGSSVGGIALNTSASQTPSATNFDASQDLLIAKKVENGATQASTLLMQFARVVAIGKMTIKNLESEAPITKITFSAKVGDEPVALAGRTNFNLETAKPVSSYASNIQNYSIILNYEGQDITASGGMVAYFTCYPFEINSSTPGSFKVVVETGTQIFTKEVNVSSAKGLAFNIGKASVFSVDMDNIEGEYKAVDLCYAYLEYSDVSSQLSNSYDNAVVAKSHGDRWSMNASNANSSVIALRKDDVSSYIKLPDFEDEISSVTITLAEVNASNSLTLDSAQGTKTGDIATVAFVADQLEYTTNLSEAHVHTAYIHAISGQAKITKVEVIAGTDTREAIDAPASVTAALNAEDANAIDVTWSTVDGAAGYVITLVPDSGDDVVVKANASPCKVSDLQYEMDYLVSVQAEPDYYLNKISAQKSAASVVTTGADTSGAIVLTDSDITPGANTVQGTNNGKLAYKMGSSSNDGSLTFGTGYSSITFTLAGWATGTRSFSITNGTINSSASLSPAAGSPSGTINANFSTTYEGTEYTIVVTNPNAEVVFSGRRCVVWGFTATLQDSRSSAPIAWKNGEDTRTTASVKKVDDSYTWLDPDGAQPTLTITTSLDKAVTYSSSVPSVATINSSTGIISLAGVGSTEIKATYAGAAGDTYKHTEVSYTLTVTPYYTVTFNRTPSNGSFNVKNGETTISTGAVVPAGATINITDITPESGYALSTLVYNDGSDHDIKSAKTFTMPAHAVSVSATFEESGGGGTKEYTLTITASDFNSTSYAANNNEKTSNAVASDSSTYEVKWTSYQVMQNSSNMQWQKSKGYIYNSTDLGTIKSVTVNSSAGSFTTYYGTTAQPDSGTAGSGKGYFKTSVGGATGTTSSVVIVFEI